MIYLKSLFPNQNIDRLELLERLISSKISLTQIHLDDKKQDSNGKFWDVTGPLWFAYCEKFSYYIVALNESKAKEILFDVATGMFPELKEKVKSLSGEFVLGKNLETT